MKHIKKALITVTVILYSGLLSAQILTPVKWSFSSKKVADKTYEVTATAKMDPSWHIYSQGTDKGGPIPTAFTYTKNPQVILKGKPAELGKMVEKYEKVFMVNTRYFSDEVKFIQPVKTTTDKPITLKGYVTFMACTDKQCLTPTDVEFEIVLK